MKIKTFFDEPTYTLTYVVWDEQTKDAIIVDPVLDYDQASSMYSTKTVEEHSQFIESEKLNLHYIIETHAHADHLTGSQELKKRFPQAKVAIGQEIKVVQKTFAQLFNMENEVSAEGTEFDRLVSDGEEIQAGSLKLKAIHTPGHTPACYSYLVGDALFTGDALFMPDFGVGRCDFPAGDARTLYKSVHEKLYKLPDSTRVFTGHDYQPNGRELKYESTIGEEKSQNIHLKESTSENEFVEFRTTRDAQLSAPKLLLPSIQVNIKAGHFPNPENNGISYLKMPVRTKNG